MFEITLSAISALLLILLSLYVFIKKKSVNGALFALFLFLIGLIEMSDQISLVLQKDFFLYKKASLLLESLLSVVMIFFSFFYARQYSLKSMSSSRWLLLAGTMTFPLIVYAFKFNELFYGYDIQFKKVLFLGHSGYWFYLGIMFYCVVALVNIENTFVASRGVERWRMKYEAIGLMAMISVLIYYYSQGVLHTTIKMNLLPVRSGVFICASLLIGYSNIVRGNSVQIAVSRHVLYRSIAVLIVGFYLIFLGLIGKGLRYFGVNFSRDIILFIAFASIITIFLALFSEKLRRKVKVLINKNFYANKYDYRREWLRFTEKLFSCKDLSNVKEAVLSSYREAFGIRGASLYLYERRKNKYILAANQSMIGIDEEFEASSSMESYFLENQRVFNPIDGEYIPNKDEHLFMQESGATILVPLLSNERIEGIVTFGERLVKEDYIYEDYDLMKTLGKQATLALLNFRFSEELAETWKIAAVAKISSFVIHDLKNLTTSLSLLLDNAEGYIREMEFQDDMLKAIRVSVLKMNALMQKLNDMPEKQKLNKMTTDIHLLIRECVDDIMKICPYTGINYQGTSLLFEVDEDEIRKVIQNLLLNAHEATNESGIIEVETGFDNDMAFIQVKDNGCGMSEDFIKNHLFKPFRTTKKKGLGIGLYQCKHIVEAHGGSIEVSSEPGKGSMFTVYLPVVNIPENVF